MEFSLHLICETNTKSKKKSTVWGKTIFCNKILFKSSCKKYESQISYLYKSKFVIPQKCYFIINIIINYIERMIVRMGQTFIYLPHINSKGEPNEQTKTSSFYDPIK